tara:strand:+ start:296 stop:583 length:288 start_codon:yes stop_codon:yes gene_type:complete
LVKEGVGACVAAGVGAFVAVGVGAFVAFGVGAFVAARVGNLRGLDCLHKKKKRTTITAREKSNTLPTQDSFLQNKPIFLLYILMKDFFIKLWLVI